MENLISIESNNKNVLSIIASLAILATNKLADISNDNVFSPKNIKDLEETNENLRNLALSHMNALGIHAVTDNELAFRHDSILNTIRDTNGGEINMVANKLASIFNNEIGMIKNKIIPLVKVLRDSVLEKISNNSEIDSNGSLRLKPTEDYKFVTIKDWELINTLMDRNKLIVSDNYNKITPTFLELTVGDIDELRNGIKSHFSFYGAEVNDLLSDITNDEIVNVFDMYLSDLSNGNLNKVVTGSSLYYKDAVILLLISSALYDKPADTVKVDLETYNNSMLEIMGVAGNTVIRLRNLIKTYKENMVVGLGEKDDNIYVLEENYHTFLNDNKIECLLGYYLTRNNTVTLQSLVEDKEDLIIKWNQHFRIVKIKKENDLLNSIKLAFKLSVKNLIDDTDYTHVKSDEIQGFLNSKIFPMIDELKSFDGLDVKLVSENLILNGLYRHTNAKEFLGYFNKYIQMDKTITEDQAALFATLSIFLDWTATQLIK